MKCRLHALILLAAAVLTSKSAIAQASQSLTLHEAEQLALRNHPQIQAALDILSLEGAGNGSPLGILSDFYGSLTGAYAENDSRIGAGALNNPVIYDRFADGLTASQLVTDFGRTHELVKSSNLHARHNRRILSLRAPMFCSRWTNRTLPSSKRRPCLP